MGRCAEPAGARHDRRYRGPWSARGILRKGANGAVLGVRSEPDLVEGILDGWASAPASRGGRVAVRCALASRDVQREATYPRRVPGCTASTRPPPCPPAEVAVGRLRTPSAGAAAGGRAARPRTRRGAWRTAHIAGGNRRLRMSASGLLRTKTRQRGASVMSPLLLRACSTPHGTTRQPGHPRGRCSNQACVLPLTPRRISPRLARRATTAEESHHLAALLTGAPGAGGTEERPADFHSRGVHLLAHAAARRARRSGPPFFIRAARRRCADDGHERGCWANCTAGAPLVGA